MADDLTQLLIDWNAGDEQALDRLMPLIYDELHRLARKHMRRERREHTLQPTALVHEAYLQLIDQNRVRWQNRTQFFAVAARLMRRVILLHARALHTHKRGNGKPRIALEEIGEPGEQRATDLVELDDALRTLTDLDSRQGRIVELRFFGGLTVEETATIMDLSSATIKREWRTARAWLLSELRKDSPGVAP